MAIRLETDQVGTVARIRLASAERGNALKPDDFACIADLVDQLAEAPGVRAIIVTGSGSVFSAGADLADLSSVGDETLANIFETQTVRISEVFERCRVPTIVSVNGAAAGAACSFALMADIAIAADTARFLFPFARLGLVPDAGSTLLLAQRIGGGHARRVLLQGGSISATQALSWGLVASVHTAPELDEAAVAAASRLGAMPAGIHLAIRNLLQDSAVLRRGLMREANAQAVRLQDPETRAAIAEAAQSLSASRR